MQFDLTTFILEIINFLILVWILQRLFYKPVLDAIAHRKQSIEQNLAEAQRLQQEANELRSQYENRQQLWEQEKTAAQADLQHQFDQQRQVQLAKLNQDLAQERERFKVNLAQEQLQFKQQVEQQALRQGARFAGMLLQQSANPELEARLIQLVIKNCTDLIEEATSLQTAVQTNPPNSIKIVTVYVMPDLLKSALEANLLKLVGRTLPFCYERDSSLMAGIRIDIGAWVIHCNLAHELSGFADLAYENIPI